MCPAPAVRSAHLVLLHLPTMKNKQTACCCYCISRPEQRKTKSLPKRRVLQQFQSQLFPYGDRHISTGTEKKALNDSDRSASMRNEVSIFVTNWARLTSHEPRNHEHRDVFPVLSFYLVLRAHEIPAYQQYKHRITSKSVKIRKVILN
jgi:hypothetical protein